MPAPKVRGHYSELAQIAQSFGANADQLNAALQRVKSAKNTLSGGDWVGRGATAFYAEMDSQVLPALQRLVNSLQQAQQVTGEISRVVERAEADAAAVFRLADSGGSSQGNPSVAVGGQAGDGLASYSPNPKDNPNTEGLDHPVDVEYKKIEGEPFIQDDGEDKPAANANDISQGAVGDCYFISSLAAVALTKPEIIENMIQENDDGTYTVTFYEKRNPLAFWEPEFKKVEITVNNEFAVYKGTDDPAFADNNAGNQRELWPMIIEKAYAQWKGGYGNIEGGYVADGLEMITGKPSERLDPGSLTIEKLAEYKNNGYAIGAGSLPDIKLTVGPLQVDLPDAHDNNPLYQDDKLYTNHAYYVTDVNTETGMVTVRNPWGWGAEKNMLIEMSFADFQKSFSQVGVNKPG